jgi:hypothetical protein
MNIEELKSSLLASPKNGYARISAEERAEMEAYCKRYMAFMDAAKTERESTAWAVAEAEKRGFVPFVPGMDAKPGDKIYYNNRGKAIALAVIGTEPLNKGANICAAHEDSPPHGYQAQSPVRGFRDRLLQDPLLRWHQEVSVAHPAPGPPRRCLLQGRPHCECDHR